MSTVELLKAHVVGVFLLTGRHGRAVDDVEGHQDGETDHGDQDERALHVDYRVSLCFHY